MRLLTILTSALMAGYVHAGSQVLNPVKVTEVWTDTAYFGGCGAKISPPISTLPNCIYPDYILFDCLNVTGTVSSKVSSNLFNAAQLALATGNDTYIRAVDNKIINGICFADKVNVSNVP